MSGESRKRSEGQRRRVPRLLVACLLLVAVTGAITALLLRTPRHEEATRCDNDVPLGVEEAVIIRYAGPRLVAQPYRRGASINLRIADEVQQDAVRVYDVRYVVNLPGEFDLTDYLRAADGNSIDDLPSFTVRGLTSLTKDIETRIREIEDVGVDIWHGYYETLAGLGVFWGLWLLGLIFIGRPKRPPKPPEPPRVPSIAEQIDRYLRALAEGQLSVEDRARLETLLFAHWRERLGLTQHRMAVACRQIRHSVTQRNGDALGVVYRELETWLHDPSATSDGEAPCPDAFLEAYRLHARGGKNSPQRGETS